MIEDHHTDSDAEGLSDDSFKSAEDTSGGEQSKTTRLSGMYREWFLDYASYVILERAVPEVRDGLKPVQRRILHAMKELDDGRYNKVANIIGHTMKYHPHGDTSIGDALVQLGQKDLLIDTQGNWGNILTGDSAAAPRYIEARPSKFALDVVYNPKTTRWKTSYDGRNKEPITLPVKFPLLLAQGVEGIAVGLASKILPHNFNELIDASIDYLKGEEPDIMPDFPSGGYADVSKYNAGMRGGKVRIRAKISIQDKKTLVINEIPFGTNTNSLMDNIVAANDKGKIKVRKIEDNTSDKVEILVHLAPGISPDQAIDALYLFTDCEVSISPNCAIIDVDKPRFLSVNEVLKISTDHTVELLKKELEIERDEMMEQLLYASLEKIFIENRIYRDIESCESWEEVIKTIDKGLDPFKKDFYREITRDDIIHLTEIKIKRISRYDAFRADKEIKKLQERLDTARHHLENLVKYAIDYYRNIKKKYGAGRERKTEIRLFDSIEATRVAVANEKLYVNREEGFAGTSLKKDEFVCECSDIDDIIVFREDGTYMVTKVTGKSFVGKNVIHIAVFERNDERTIYNVIYRDGAKGATYVKRFAVKGVTRDKEYDLSRGTKGSKILYFTANPNGEAEVVTVYLRHRPRLKKTVFDFDFSELAIKGRAAGGNILSKHPVRRIVLKDEGVSTLGAIDIWFDDTVLRLNADKRGKYLGAFKGDEKILAVYAAGTLRVMNFDLSNHFDELPQILHKLHPGTIITAVYFDAAQGFHYIKRFEPEANGKVLGFIGEDAGNKLVLVTTEKYPRLLVKYPPSDRRQKTEEELNVEEFIAVKSPKARGKRISSTEITDLSWLEPLKKDEEAHEEPIPQIEEPDKDPDAQAEASIKANATMDADAEKEDGDFIADADSEADADADAETEDSEPKPQKTGPKPGDKERQIRLDLDI